MAELKGKATVLLVRDVEQSLAYYRDKLGFEVWPYEENPSHYGYANRGECWFHFACWDGVEPQPNSALVPPDMFDAYLYVDDIPALHAELAERGANLMHGPEERPWTSLEIRVRDPDGYVLAFGQLESG
jgi:catechol 2,3-dioxygenase-like lactoylglutathione lyase family enzyme